jgi:hypothetical protein
MAFTSNLKSLTPRRTQFQTKITLLSGGYVKPDAFPNGQITVYPWDTHVDDWLADRMKKGNQHMVLYELCAKVCDMGTCPLDKFIIGDVNTVLLVSRSLRYSSRIEYEARCPSCSNREVHVVKVPDELGKVGEKPAGYPGYDEITLPESADIVYARPLSVRDERLVAERDETSRKMMTDHVMHILMPIMAINGGTPDSLDQVLQWFDALSPQDAAYLESQQNQLYPHLDTDIPHRCDKCGTEFKHPLDFSQDFFRRSLKPGKGAAMAVDVRPGSEQQKPGGDSQRPA